MFKKKSVRFYEPLVEIPLNQTDKLRYLDLATKRQIRIAGNRMIAVSIFFLTLLGICMVRLYQLTVMDYRPPVYKDIKDELYSFERHNILDRNMQPLASNVRTYDVSLREADRKYIKGDVKALAKEIASFLSLNEQDVYKKLTKPKGFDYIKRKCVPKEYNEILQHGYYFLTVEESTARAYVQSNILSHLLGTVNIDNQGISGIEKSFNNILEEKDLVLSIDISVQSMVEDIMRAGLEKYKAKAALAVVMNVNNGELLASLSLPDYNPSAPVKDKNDLNRFNQVTLGTYEFGSIFKLFNTANALDSKIIKVTDIFDATHPYKMKGAEPIKDVNAEGRPLTITEIIMHSSNIGSAQIGLKIGEEKQREFFDKLGFYQKLPIPLPERGSPLFKKGKLNAVESSRISYGYGIAVTPLHLIAGVAALVNGGIYIVPTFIKGGNNGQAGVQVIKKETSDMIRHMMWASINWNIKETEPLYRYMIGGKTGSKEALVKGKYQSGKLRTSFVGAFPMNNPQYIVLVSLDEPQKIKETHMLNTAGWNAKKLGIKIIEQISPYLGVLLSSEWKQPNYVINAIERTKTAREIKTNKDKR